MALTQISTAGVKDDAVTAGKIPADAIGSSEIAANAVGSSELADNAVDTAAIADDAVTAAKLANTSVTAASYGSSTSIPSITVDAQGRITAASGNTVNTDLVGDTSPQLGGDLDSNGNNIKLGDNDQLRIGASNDIQIYHDTNNSVFVNNTGDLYIQNDSANDTNKILIRPKAGENSIECTPNGAVSLYYDNVKKIESGTNYNFIYAVSNGNPAGLKIRNVDANSNYSHAELRLESKNAASYGSIFNDHQNGCVRIGHNTTGNTLEIFNDGVIRMQGIKFGSDISENNNLHDYEEGTWTPSMQWSAGTGTAGTANNGYYTKIGNIVHVHATVHWTAVSGSTVAYARINGLPYPYKNASNYRSTVVIGGQVVGVRSGEHSNVALGSDANNSFLYITPFNNASQSGSNYSHTPFITASGIIYGLSVTYLTN